MPSQSVDYDYLATPAPLANSDAWLDQLFTDKLPNARQQEKLDAIYFQARQLADMIIQAVPQCADRATAIRKLREACHTVRDAVVQRALV